MNAGFITGTAGTVVLAGSLPFLLTKSANAAGGYMNVLGMATLTAAVASTITGAMAYNKMTADG